MIDDSTEPTVMATRIPSTKQVKLGASCSAYGEDSQAAKFGMLNVISASSSVLAAEDRSLARYEDGTVVTACWLLERNGFIAARLAASIQAAGTGNLVRLGCFAVGVGWSGSPPGDRIE